MTGPPNYTTTMAPEKTAAECVLALGRFGASQVTLFFGARRLPTGLTFIIETERGQSAYKIGVDFARAQRVLAAHPGVPRKNSGREQAERTAWKTLKDWLDFQLTMIETGLLEAEQALYPYVVSDTGRTVYELAAERRSVTSGAVVEP
jgi:hypothetical protein